MHEKRIAEVTVRMSETLKHDLQDRAMNEDRTVSEVMRVIIEDFLYGVNRRLRDEAAQEPASQTLRGRL